MLVAGQFACMFPSHGDADVKAGTICPATTTANHTTIGQGVELLLQGKPQRQYPIVQAANILDIVTGSLNYKIYHYQPAHVHATQGGFLR